MGPIKIKTSMDVFSIKLTSRKKVFKGGEGGSGWQEIHYTMAWPLMKGLLSNVFDAKFIRSSFSSPSYNGRFIE